MSASEERRLRAARSPGRSEELVAFGTRVRVLRLAAGLTQQALADAMGVHRDSIVKLESGMREIGVTRVGALAQALGIDPGKLFIVPSERESS